MALKDLEEREMRVWTPWGACVTLTAGLIPEGSKKIYISSIAEGSIRRFSGFDHEGETPLRKERFPGESLIWQWKEAADRAAAVVEERGEGEAAESDEGGSSGKPTVEESRALHSLNKERRKRSLPALTALRNAVRGGEGVATRGGGDSRGREHPA